jgi:hypothetical protein
MSRFTTLLIAAAIALATAVPATAAAGSAGPRTPDAAARFAPPRVTSMRLAVEITGIHVVDWHLQEEGFPDPSRAWVAGKGTQTLGFSAPRPVVYLATAASGTTPDGTPLSPLAVVPLHEKPEKGSLRRRASWRHSDGPSCDSEGHCEDPVLVPPLHQTPSCPAKRLPVPVKLEVTGPAGAPVRNALTVSFASLGLDGLWNACPPDIDGAVRPLALAQPHAVTIPGGVGSIARLHRGQKVTLKGSYQRGITDRSAESRTCPRLGGIGQQECAVTDVTVEVTRLR